jgi:molecular chaperone IbpA
VNALDFSPLFRTAIGFDRLARLADTARAAADAPSYPPYNIERTADDAYTLTMAVAGFGQDDIEITAQDNVLLIAGKAPQASDDSRFLHRGIAGRAFERRFVLADHIRVEGANLENGLLHVALRREVPEALKPRRIAIGSTRPQQPAIEGRAEAANTQEGQAQAA